MKKLFKLLIVALSFVFVLGLFAACGQTPPPASNPGSGTRQGGKNQDGGFDGEIDKF